jgi:flagellar biosynthesis protein FlhA
MTSLILFLLSMVPGLPQVSFISLAVIIGIIGVVVYRRQQNDEAMAIENSQESAKDSLKKPENLLNTLTLDPISLRAGRNLVPLIDPSLNGPLLERITLVRYHIGQELGFVIPGVRVMDDLSLSPNQYDIEIRGTRVASGEVLPGHIFVNANLSDLKRKGISGGVEVVDPATNEIGTWLSEEQQVVLQENVI